jgi:hypothetical protein
MTSEERVRMNSLCAGIQEEKDYNKFAALLHEMSELIARKEQRRFQQYPKLVWQRNRPWRTIPAVVSKIVKPIVADQPEKVEIAVEVADDLFREIRIQNTLTDVDGGSVSLTKGAQLEITLEAQAKYTVKRTPSTAV